MVLGTVVVLEPFQRLCGVKTIFITILKALFLHLFHFYSVRNV